MAIITRQIQSVNFAVIIFYYGCVAVPATLAMIFIEAWCNDAPLRILSYNGAQFGWIISLSVISFAGLASQTVAA